MPGPERRRFPWHPRRLHGRHSGCCRLDRPRPTQPGCLWRSDTDRGRSHNVPTTSSRGSLGTMPTMSPTFDSAKWHTCDDHEWQSRDVASKFCVNGHGQNGSFADASELMCDNLSYVKSNRWHSANVRSKQLCSDVGCVADLLTSGVPQTTLTTAGSTTPPVAWTSGWPWPTVSIASARCPYLRARLLAG